MTITAIVRALVAAGASGEMILAAVEAAEAANGGAIEERRRADRERKQRQRSRDSHVTSRDVTGQDVTSQDNPPSPSLPPQTPPSRPHPPVGSSREGARGAVDLEAEFSETFWPAYPHKVGKPDAQRKFVAARRGTRLDEIMAGLDRYVASKPADRPWCNPATWLNQQRWADEPAPAPVAGPRLVHPPPAPKMKSVGHRVAERLRAIAEGSDPEPQSDLLAERTIDVVATRR